MKCKRCALFVSAQRQRKKALFCSRLCRIKWEREEWRRKNVSPGDLSRCTVGAMAELLVSHDLLKKGFEVFRALSPGASCDLAILKNKELIRVEVKTSYRTQAGTIYQPKAKAGSHDVLALVLNREEVVYLGLF